MVLAIFTVITAVVIFNYGEFNSKTILSNVAYEVALSVRQAQVYSLSVRGEAGATDFNNHYGVYANTTTSNKDIVFFIDRVESVTGEPNGICGTNEGNCLSCLTDGECLEKITLTRDITIDKLCVSAASNPVNTETGSCESGAPVEDLTITFERPNPDAVISVGGIVQSNVSAAIVLTTSFGNKRAIIVRQSGQISVQNINESTI